ncbi:putative serine/threonine protein kinase [Trypanosoma cruzi]|nr:putative serine/threonine protein kinase [Trypanosoma cruzi]
MGLEGDRLVTPRQETAKSHPASVNRIEIPRLTMPWSASGQQNSATGAGVQLTTLPALGTVGASTAASNLYSGDLGKQMAAAEVSNKISSRALLNTTALRTARSISCMEVMNNESSPDLSSKEMGSIHAMLLDASPRQGRKDFKAADAGTSGKERTPILVKRCSDSIPSTPLGLNGLRIEETGEQNTVTLEEMLREASEVHGISLKWILYGVMLVTVLIFLMLLGEVHLFVKDNIIIPEEGLVGISSATAMNQLEWLQYSVTNMLHNFELIRGDPHDTSTNYTLGILCRSIGGAPLVFARYGPLGTPLLESYACPSATTKPVVPPTSIGTQHKLPTGFPRMAVYRSDFIIAMMTLRAGSEVLTVILHKEPVGRLLLANSIPTYSSLALKHSATSFFLPDFSSLKIVVALHSLDAEYTRYDVAQPTSLGHVLKNVFNGICAAGEFHTWHTVVRPDTNKLPMREHDMNVSHNALPGAYVAYRGLWGSVSRVVICGVLCLESEKNECSSDNPTRVWFIVDDEPLRRETEIALTAVSIISSIAIFLVLVALVIAYLSISAPVQHLKSLVFNTVGDKWKKTKQQQWVFHHTRNCWPGDLQALVRSFQVLSFCFRFNKKYVPQHVLEQQVVALRKRKDYLWRTIVEEIESDDDEEYDGEEEDMVPGVNDRMDMEAFVKTVAIPDGVAAMGRFNGPEGMFQRELSWCGLISPDVEILEASGNNFLGHSNIDLAGGGMTLVEGATVLVVRLCAVELAYFTNYRAALKPHRRIMNLLLGRIRRYRGELFERSGDCIAAAWNAFESRTDHAQRAAACALSIAKMLSCYREAGFRVGIVLHQGPFVCGVVEDNKEAFTTVFGTVPRQAIALAELASSLPYFRVLVSEPVKQSLASLYECIMVDVIKYHEEDNPIVMFELYEERRPPLVKGALLSSSTFAEEHARVFFDFRNHDFARAMMGIEQLRLRFPGIGRRLLTRIEILCKYYMYHENELPMPYFRPFPIWPNFEAIANTECPSDIGVQSTKEDSFLDPPRYLRPTKSIYEDEAVNFRQELHDKVLASKRTQNQSPTLKAANDAPSKDVEANNAQSPRSLIMLSQTQNILRSTPSLEPETGEGDDAAPKEHQSKPLLRVAVVSPHEEHAEQCVGADKKRCSGASAGKEEVNREEFAPSIREPTSNPCATAAASATGSDEKGDPGDEENDVTGRQRFSLTNRMGLAFPECRSCSFFCGTDSLESINSETVVTAPTFSLCNIDGSLTKVASEIPTEIVAKNGITYQRSSRILGKGSFGCVYLGMDILSGRMVAIKFLPLPSEEEEIANVEREVVTMQKVKSNQVVEFISYAFKSNLIIIVMECMMAGSLQGMISAFGSIPGTTARLFIRDVLRGLHKLHSLGVIHRDVKPQNVLLTLAGNCKISDFGASAFLQELVRRRMEGKGLQIQGTPIYLAPESARGTPEEKSDIWSCGIMFIQLVTGKLPYAKPFLEMSPQILVYQIGSGAAKPIIPESLDEFDAEFVCNCLKDDPNERLSAQRLLELPLFAL